MGMKFVGIITYQFWHIILQLPSLIQRYFMHYNLECNLILPQEKMEPC